MLTDDEDGSVAQKSNDHIITDVSQMAPTQNNGSTF